MMIEDKKGVSPVIGVILMVALTVIMAAIVASFTAGLGKVTRSPPTANLVVEDDPLTSPNNCTWYTLVKITHKGGDAIFINETKTIITNKETGDRIECDGVANTKLKWYSSTYNSSNEPDTITDYVFSTGEVRYLAVDGEGTAGFNVSGVFNIMIIHKPTNQLILDVDVFCE